jgi:enoyl-CoA hydratase/carnithine racemase
MGATRARQLGICSQVVDPPSALRDAAQALGEAIALTPLDELRAKKRALWAALEDAPVQRPR